MVRQYRVVIHRNTVLSGPCPIPRPIRFQQRESEARGRECRGPSRTPQQEAMRPCAPQPFPRFPRFGPLPGDLC